VAARLGNRGRGIRVEVKKEVRTKGEREWEGMWRIGGQGRRGG
jgi:hypothetical protein